jgi:fused signal recognition particle receptor
VEQLAIWAARVEAELIKHPQGSDPSAVAYDAIHAAHARPADLLFIDTAGRLHTQVNLMEQLRKIKRIVNREMAGAPHEVLLVLDATTGQNAINQARLFHEALQVTGIALTKLDGTAKGGIIVSICRELGIPIHYVGVGEGLGDLQPFDAKQFVGALFE